MAKNKIQRIDQEIAKVREKIAEYQDKLKTLEAQKTEAENLEIVQMVRALRLTPEQLNAMLSGGTVPGMAAASANYNEQEDTLPRGQTSPRQRTPPTTPMWWWRKPRTARP